MTIVIYPGAIDFFLDSVVQICYNEDMDVRSKIWLEIDGEPVFGSGRRALLESIEKFGSINKAAKDTNISYRKALSYIQNMESRLGKSLVERHTGGRNGGGASLTEEARHLLSKYEKLEKGINELLDLRFLEIFGNGNNQ
jgi:molybdate transport system regulatory protein